MKIVSVYIHSFGKLQNFDCNFHCGINVLQQTNGFGKTTLCNFIRAMLYGFTYGRRTRGGESISDVAVWKNWNSSEKIGGSMEVEHNGATYRIERYFGLTAKTETLSVINELTGRTESIAEPGEYFLGLTADSFDRSAYLPQESVTISSNENFDTRLAGLVQNAEDFDTVERTLQEYLNNLTSSRRANSELNVAERQKYQLQQAIQKCQQDEFRQKAIDAELQELEVQRQSLEESVKNHSENVAEAQRRLGQSQLSPEQIRAREKLLELQQKVSRVGDNFEADVARCDELDKRIQNTPDLAQKQRKISKPLLVLGIILLLVGIGMCFLQLIVGICAVAAGIVIAVLSFFVHPALTTLPSGERDALVSEYFKLAGKHVFCDGDYAQVKKELWTKFHDYQCDKREIAELNYVVNSQKRDDQTNHDLDGLKKQLEHEQSLLVELAAKRGRLQEERKNLKVDSVELREKLQETQIELETIRHKEYVATKTLELLRQAKENLSLSYLPALKDSCTNLLQQVTAQNLELVLDREFNLKLRANGVTKSLDFYSRGIREITLLCFRIAISRLLFNGEIPLLLVDDAFVNFDEKNFERATKLLDSISENTQIIYMTCHKRLGNLA